MMQQILLCLCSTTVAFHTICNPVPEMLQLSSSRQRLQKLYATITLYKIKVNDKMESGDGVGWNESRSSLLNR